MSEILKVRSKLKDYEVRLVEDFAVPLRSHARADSFLLIDQKIAELYGSRLQGVFPPDRSFMINAVEQNKNIEYCYEVLKALVKNNIRRNNQLIALGGGITQDITSFIGSILFRGVEWLFFPTTLLAQADSCVGSKSSINFGEYKNLLGTFYPPSKIFIDVDFLNTLPVEEIRSGIGEMLHFYLIAGSDLADRLMDEYEKILTSPAKLKRYILASLEIKKRIVEIDEFDQNERNVFNYGHTFGHALETVSGYAISHGQAVTMGMDIADYLSLRLGHLDSSTFASMHSLLAKNFPAFHLKSEQIDRYLTALARDKKNLGNNLGCILTHGPGSMMKTQIPFDEKLKDMLEDYFFAQKPKT